MALTKSLSGIKGLRCAIGGVPFMIDGKEVSLSKDIKTQGWSGGNFNQTWHTFLTVQDGYIWYIGANVGNSNDVTATTVIWQFLKGLGCTGTVIKLDGGGSFIFRREGRLVCATAENRKIDYIGTFKIPPANSGYQWPFKGKFTFGTAYGVKGNSWICGWHSGLDLKGKNYGGDGRVYPIAAGKVTQVSATGSYGNHVYVLHDDGYLSLYAHLSYISVVAGQKVDTNTVLGIEGTTGNSTGVHLHIEVHRGAYSYPASIDPKAFIEQRLTKEETAMANDDFEKLFAEHEAAVREKAVSSWAAASWEKAVKKGIVDGTMPQSYPTREQLITILDRMGLIK